MFPMIPDGELTYADAVKSRTAGLLDEAAILREKVAKLEAEAARLLKVTVQEAAIQRIDALYAEADADGTPHYQQRQALAKISRLYKVHGLK